MSVRRVWRIEPDRFALKNPEWDRLVNGIVAEVQEGLGLEGQKLGSHLHDLLVYEPGSFFLPHRDGEKLGRMVATLVVALPSTHEGGELVVRHDGQERTIELGGPSGDPFRIHYAAFYADCEHEVRPLKTGFRLCLVYNLTLAKSKKPPSAPRDSEHVERIAPLVREWAEGKESTEKLAITLDHRYTQAGLSWDALKGTDRVKARALAEAAGRANCRAYLALPSLHQSGYGEEAGGGYGYGRGGRYNRYDDEEDDEDGGEYRMVEVYDTSLTADHWSDPEGNRVAIGELKAEEDEVLNPELLTDVDPEEEYEGYTGNEGMTLDRWYRHAAILIWRDDRHFEILCRRDSRRVVPELLRMIGQRKRAGAKDKAAIATRCRALAAAIIAGWPEERYAGAEAETEENPASGLLEALAALDLPDLIGDFLGSALTRDASADPGAAVAAVGQKYGWPTFKPPLVSMMKETTTESLARNVRLLESICTARPRKKKEGWGDLCAALARELISAIEVVDRKRSPAGYFDEDLYPENVDRAAVLAGLARSLIATGQSELMSRLIDHAFAAPKKYPLSGAHVGALVGLRPWLKKHLKVRSPALTNWLDSVRGQLEALTAREPQEPADFRRAAPIKCDCADCSGLKQFLSSTSALFPQIQAYQELARPGFPRGGAAATS